MLTKEVFVKIRGRTTKESVMHRARELKPGEDMQRIELKIDALITVQNNLTITFRGLVEKLDGMTAVLERINDRGLEHQSSEREKQRVADMEDYNTKLVNNVAMEVFIAVMKERVGHIEEDEVMRMADDVHIIAKAFASSMKKD